MNTLYHPGAALNQELMGAGRFIPRLLPGWGRREELVRVPEWWLSRPSQILVSHSFPGTTSHVKAVRPDLVSGVASGGTQPKTVSTKRRKLRVRVTFTQPGCVALEGGCGWEGHLPATLMACLHFCFQIRRHPSFKSFFYQLPDASLAKLVAILRSQEAHALEPHRNLAERPYQYPFGLAHKFPGNNRHTALSLMRLRYPQFPHTEAQQVRDGDGPRDDELVATTASTDCPLPSLPSSGLLGSSSNDTSLPSPSETIPVAFFFPEPSLAFLDNQRLLCWALVSVCVFMLFAASMERETGC